MAEELNYWQRLHRKRLSRRRLMGSAAVGGVGLAGLALVGCGDDDDDDDDDDQEVPEDEVQEEDDDDEEAEDDDTAEVTFEPVGTTGGTYRYYGFDALPLDSIDPHQTQFGPIYSLHAAIFSKVLNYVDDYREIIEPDLSEDMPEQVDDVTYTIKIRPNATYHDNPQLPDASARVGARQVTADDVAFMINRQVNLESPQAALYYRRSQWDNVESLEVVDAQTLTVTLKRPVSAFLHFLADRNSYVVPPELVDQATDTMNDPSLMLGSGPFMYDRFEALVTAKLVRNPNWHAADDNPGGVGMGRPFLDGYEADGAFILQSDDNVARLSFESKQKDAVGFSDNNNIEAVMADIPDLILEEWGVAGYVNSRLLIDRPPFNDVRVRQAVHLAQDRNQLGQKLYQQFFRASANIAWPMTRWALPQEELITIPGYRFGATEREEDIQMARDLLEASGAAADLEGMQILFAGVPGEIPNVALPETLQRLQENLGVSFTSDVDPTGYTALAQCLSLNTQGATEGTCAFTWGFDNGWIHWYDWLYPFFHSTGAKNSFRVNDPELDRMLDEAVEIFDYDEAHERVLEIQRYLLSPDAPGAAFSQLPYVNELGRSVLWPYVKNSQPFSWFGHTNHYANMWLDSTHPEYPA